MGSSLHRLNHFIICNNGKLLMDKLVVRTIYNT